MLINATIYAQGETLKIQDFVLLGMPTLIEKKKIY